MKTLFKLSWLVAFWMMTIVQLYAQQPAASVSEAMNQAATQPTFQARYNSTQSAAKTMACGDFNFSPTSYAGEGYSDDLIAGDFNGDGAADIVRTSSDGSFLGVQLYLNNGSGAFSPASKIASAGSTTAPWRVAAGDVNNDGKLDLVVGHNDPSTKINVRLGNGDGTFQTASQITTQTKNVPELGDMNGDGKLDLVVVGLSSQVWIYAGNGDGTFGSSPTTQNIGSTPTHLTIQDFNADGKLDVAVTNFSSSTVSVLLGNGDGTLNTATHLSTGTSSFPFGIESEDLDLDGDFDFAVTLAGTGKVGIMTNNGRGGFITPVTYSVGSGPRGIGIGDFDDDGKLDIVTGNFGGSNYSILEGNGDATFAATCNTATASGTWAAVAADFNKDGTEDFALVTAGYLDVYLSGPVVVTSAATAVTTSSATLNGTINPKDNTIVSAEFRYGTDPTLATFSTQTVDVSSVGTGSSPVAVLANLINLLPNTTYYFRLVATYCEGACLATALGKTEQSGLNIKTIGGFKSTASMDGLPTVMGSILNFTTSAVVLPAVTTTAATAVMASSATLNGTINPKGNTIVSAVFRYGTDPTLATFSTQTVDVSSVGTGSSPVAVSANVTELEASSTYYFQLVATYSSVLNKTETISPTVKGEILSFTTPAQYRPPVFTIPDVASGEDGKPFSFELKAEDADGDPITYHIISGPDWLTLTEEGGVYHLKGRAGQRDVGVHVVRIAATSGSGAGLLTTEFTITITIANVEYPPVFNSLDTVGGEDCKPLSHTLKATDLDGENISYRIVSGPSWLTLKEEVNGGVSLQGLPGQSETGVHVVKIAATSGSGAGLRTVEQTLTVTITDVAHPPVFSNLGLWGVVTQTGSMYSQSFTVNDCDGGSLRLYSDDLPSWISFGTAIPGLNSLTQSISGTTHTVGHYLFSLIASDGVSNAVLPLSVYVKPYYTPVVSSVPATTFASQTVSYPIEVVAEDGDPFMVSLTAAPSGLSLVCNGTASTSGVCKGSERAELKGTVTTASLPAWVKIRVSDDVMFNGQSSCQEFELFMDGSTLTARNAQKTKCDGTPLVPTIQNRKATSTEEDVPSSFALSSVYPNPFNPSTQISFSVPVTSPVRLEVFDLNGRVVATPFNQTVSAGSYTVSFQAQGLSSGVYFVRMTAQNKVFSKQMVLMK